jgi:hypothetical protein
VYRSVTISNVFPGVTASPTNALLGRFSMLPGRCAGGDWGYPRRGEDSDLRGGRAHVDGAGSLSSQIIPVPRASAPVGTLAKIEVLCMTCLSLFSGTQGCAAALLV